MQRQIYNLMKFDSYPRFLKSHVYKESIRLVMGKDWYGEGSDQNYDQYHQQYLVIAQG